MIYTVRSLITLALVTCTMLWSSISWAECAPRWSGSFGLSGMTGDGWINCLHVFDDGSGNGPELYAGGGFNTAGGNTAKGAAKWNGTTWSQLAGGISDPTVHLILAMTIFDDGSGPALYAGGTFKTAGGVTVNNIAKWNGTSWSPLGVGMNGTVRALAVFDDGSGTALYAGGSFTTAGGISANRIAKWNGVSWSPLGNGMNLDVNALAVFDDGSGSGPALYAGGQFNTVDGVGISRIAKWNGSSWSSLGTGLNSTVFTLTVFDDGNGLGLYAGGLFSNAGGVSASHIAKWNGSSWTALGSGVNADLYTLTVYDDGSGSGPALYAGGIFTSAGGMSANRIAKWNGTTWSPLGDGVDSAVLTLTVFHNKGTPVLYAGGSFQTAGNLAARNIAQWDGTTWIPEGRGMSGSVRALTIFDDGSPSGPAMYAGGVFKEAAGRTTNFISKWNGLSWTTLGNGMNSTVRAMTVFDDGSGSGLALYAGGFFTKADGVNANHIAKWNGSAWTPLSNGVDGLVNTLAVYDDGSGPALYVGGYFKSASGISVNHIAKWNGSTWSSLGGGMNAEVCSLTVFDDGSGGGPTLYAGGRFKTAGGVSANHIAKWNGSTWSPLGSGTDKAVFASTVFDDGGGSALYVGGDFVVAGGVAANHIAKWNGSVWSSLGSGITGGSLPRVRALAVMNNHCGGNPILYVGGRFMIAGGLNANHIAAWNGSSWSTLDSGTDNTVRALSVLNTGAYPILFAGGDFFLAGSINAGRIAQWHVINQN